ncbi:MAG: hypothetical protein KC646_04570 [Candidatus Cloacimonetes bacterium]|nr:hypothetical protein [Candidatus Cloacimonadota bacterium]
MALILYIIISIQISVFADSLYYKTITQILLSNNNLQTSPVQELNIENVSKQLSDYKNVLYPHIGLNYINKNNIRRYLNQHNIVVQQVLHSINHKDQIKDISWAFLVLYRKDSLQNNKTSNLLIDAQDMYNIFYHLYNYNQILQRKTQ